MTAGFYDWAVEVDPAYVLSWLDTGDLDPDAIALESFVLDPGRAREQAGRVNTAELIGAIKLIGSQKEIPVYEQQPSVRKVAESSPFWKQNIPLDVVKELKSTHALDALRHAVYLSYFGPPGSKRNR